MSVGINTNLIRSNQYGSSNKSSQTGNTFRRNTPASSDASKNTLTARALEQQQKQNQRPTSVVDQAIAYAGQLSASRTKVKEAALEKKKIQYSYKKISSQIVRSKTSTSAKRAASAARREVQRLKRLKNSGEYDEEELQISIEHAKSMERVAKKKAAHLSQEEMIERTHNGAFANLEEKEEEIRDKDMEENEDQELSEEELAALEQEASSEEYIEEDFIEEEMLREDFAEELQIEMADIQDEMAYRMEELAAELQEEMAEVLDLTELAETMVAPSPNMSEDDLKMLKIKHRTKEMKEISEADADYLKAIFDKMQRDAGKAVSQAASSSAATAPTSATPSGGVSHTPAPVSVTVPGSYSSGGGSMSFDAFV